MRTYPFAKIIKDLDLYQCLMMESLLVSDNFDGD